MNIVFKVKPIVMTAPTKNMLMHKICRNHSRVFNTNGNFLTNQSRTKHRAYNLIKLRAKFKVNANGSRTKIRSGHWIAYVYDLPTNVIVQQNTRNFEIIDTKF